MDVNFKRPAPVDVREALKTIKVSREAFYKKLKSGELPSYRFGKKYLVDVDEILTVMRQGSGAVINKVKALPE